MRKMVHSGKPDSDPGQDNTLGLMHLRKLFSDFRQPTPGITQQELEDKLYNMLPLYCKVSGSCLIILFVRIAMKHISTSGECWCSLLANTVNASYTDIIFCRCLVPLPLGRWVRSLVTFYSFAAMYQDWWSVKSGGEHPTNLQVGLTYLDYVLECLERIYSRSLPDHFSKLCMLQMQQAVL